MNKKVKSVFKILMCCIVAFATLLIMSGCKGEEINDKDAQKIYELNLSCIQTEERSIEMKNETQGISKIKVTYPDYKALFLKGSNHRNFEKYMTKALKTGEYETKTDVIEAIVEVKDGKEIVYEDEAVDLLINKELRDAANAVYEKEMNQK